MLRIGELLVAANIIKPEVLSESLQIAKTSKTLIGRTLISLGQLDEQKLQAALDIQILIRKRLVGPQLGINALSMACSSRISANEALQKLGWQAHKEPEARKNSLAQLIIDSGIVSVEVLTRAEQQSKENNLPLGRCLVVNRYMTQNRLEAILAAQGLVKDNQITKEQALKALKLSSANTEPLEHSLIQFGIQQLGESDKRILDMLSLAGFITETSKLTALETSLIEERSCNEVLIESELVTADVIDQALTLQVQILTGNLTLKRAANLLKRSQTEGVNLKNLINDLQTRQKIAIQIEQLLDLLKCTGILAEESLATAKNLAEATGKHLGEVLVSQNEISASNIEAAWQAQRMIDDKMISFDYACNALRKLSGNNKESLMTVQEDFQHSPDNDASANIPRGNWLIELTKKLFKK